MRDGLHVVAPRAPVLHPFGVMASIVARPQLLLSTGWLGIVGVVLARPTDGASLFLLVVPGVMAVIAGWAFLTNWHGAWDEFVRWRARASWLERLVFGALGPAAKSPSLERGIVGSAAVVVGPLFIAAGILGGTGSVPIG